MPHQPPPCTTLLWHWNGHWYKTDLLSIDEVMRYADELVSRSGIRPTPMMAVLPQYADVILAAIMKHDQTDIDGTTFQKKPLDNGESFLPVPDATGHP